VTSRAERAAENENLFRRINERVEELSQGLDDLSIVCECADAGCVARIRAVPVAEYEAVRRHADRFFVVVGHERSDVETVVDERTAYLIVSKQGVAGEVARNDDPRPE
jgi:hypothetical protein